VATKQLTIRFDRDLERTLREEARREGVSLNRAAVRFIRKGAGLDRIERSDVVASSLDHLAGTWPQEDADAFDRAMAVFERVDEDLWR
jgi:hypothetical protein